MTTDKHFIVLDETTNRDLQDAMNEAWSAGYGLPVSGPCIMPAATIEGEPFGGWLIMEMRPLAMPVKPYEPPSKVEVVQVAVEYTKTPVEKLPDRVSELMVSFTGLTHAEQIKFIKDLPDAALRAAYETFVEDWPDEDDEDWLDEDDEDNEDATVMVPVRDGDGDGE